MICIKKLTKQLNTTLLTEFKGATLLKTTFMQQVEEIEIKTSNQGFCLKMPPWFYIHILNLVLLVMDSRTGCIHTTRVLVHPCCTHHLFDIRHEWCMLISHVSQDQRGCKQWSGQLHHLTVFFAFCMSTPANHH